MPLYEYLIIAKPGPAKPTVKMLHDLVKVLLTTHPSVTIRDVQNLGDRILGQHTIRETRTYKIGRYIQILMDAPPAAGTTLTSHINKFYKEEVFGKSLQKVDDLDYALNAYFRATRYISQFNDEKDYEYAKRVMEMKKKLED